MNAQNRFCLIVRIVRRDNAIADATAPRSPRINTTSGTIQSSLTSEQIMDKPTVMNINNVNQFLSLAETFAGFQENPTSGQNNPTASSGSVVTKSEPVGTALSAGFLLRCAAV